MKNLNKKIVKKLSSDLNLSEKTVKKNIYLLAKFYPHATKNALAQIYAGRKKVNIFRLLDAEDRQSLPSFSLVEKSRTNNISKIRVLEEDNRKDRFQLSRRKTIWQKILSPQGLVALLLTLLAGIIAAIFQVEYSSWRIPTAAPQEIVTIPSVSPKLAPTNTPTITTNQPNGSISIKEGESFTDQPNGLRIGVNYIFSNSYADLTITFPGSVSQEFKEVKSGRVFSYVAKDSRAYILTIVKIDYNGIEISIQEDM